ncbi:MAG: hypothetical protein EBW14_20800, partial [Oxalobacteraceae bacterium]|nr:hypothetical protein [Oxalobacteraceae bacterium]
PEENVKDLIDIPDNVKNRLEIVPVKWIDQVLDLALQSKPAPLPEDSEVAVKAVVDAPAVLKTGEESLTTERLKH